MLKKLVVLLVLLMFVFTAIPAYAADYNRHDRQESVTYTSDWQEPVIYKSTIYVTEDGGTYQVGFATVKFPKNFISNTQLPVRIEIEVSAVNGVAGIEFTPDIPYFNKDVTISAKAYNGLLYDTTSNTNITVNVRNQVFKVKHFSRYAFS